MSLKVAKVKLQKWRINFEELKYEIIYKKGNLNTNSDTLSWMEIHAKDTESLWHQINDILETNSNEIIFESPTRPQENKQINFSITVNLEDTQIRKVNIF